jgi:exopolyphosphatase/guanosine-5'-triphosphate,3'-diphosphate pyrophosphatase
MPTKEIIRNEAAVIEIGSTSIRMAVARRQPDGTMPHMDDLDLPVGLGRDTFTTEEISADTTERCVAAIRKFQEALDELGVSPENLRVVATSAVREARNQDVFKDRVLIATGLPVEVLSEAAVSRLSYLAVRPWLQNQDFFKTADTFVVEVGGGSTEILAFARGRVKAAHVNRLGSLRMQRELGDYARGEHGMAAFEEYLSFPVAQMAGSLATDGEARMVALGGETRLVRDVLTPRKAMHSGNTLSSVKVPQIRAFINARLAWPVEQIAREHSISEHQAETLLPALAIYVSLAEALGQDQILVAGASLRDGVLTEMFSGRTWEGEFRHQTLHSTRTLARKYQANLKHADNVAAAARALLAFIGRTVRFEPRDDILLHVAALLHEIGMFVNTRAYHKHSLYLIENSEIFGLDADEIGIVARIARYHRRAAPRPTHEEFSDLPSADRVRVAKLAAILRVADALDFSHEGSPVKLQFETRRDALVIHAQTHDDLTLMQRQMDARAEMFRTVFGLRVTLCNAREEATHEKA